MGMFDSLLVEIDGREFELQSKRFDCSLSCYRLGDVVDAAPAGVRILFDTLRLDADGKPVYGEGVDVVDYTIFLVLVHSVFTDYVVVQGEVRADFIEGRIAELREAWSDGGRLVLRWVEFLREKQAANIRYRYRLDSALSVVNHALELQEGKPPPERIRGIFDQPLARLEGGEDPLRVLHDVLSAETEAIFWGANQSPAADSLEDYRL